MAAEAHGSIVCELWQILNPFTSDFHESVGTIDLPLTNFFFLNFNLTFTQT